MALNVLDDKKSQEEIEKAKQAYNARPRLPNDLAVIFAADANKVPPSVSSIDVRSTIIGNYTTEFLVHDLLKSLEGVSGTEPLSKHVQLSDDPTANATACWSAIQSMTVQDFRDFCIRTRLDPDNNQIHLFERAVGNASNNIRKTVESARANVFKEQQDQPLSGLVAALSARNGLASALDGAVGTDELVTAAKDKLLSAANLPEGAKELADCQEIFKRLETSISTIPVTRMADEGTKKHVSDIIAAATTDLKNTLKNKVDERQIESITASLKHMLGLNLELYHNSGINSESSKVVDYFAKKFEETEAKELANLLPAEKLAKTLEIAAKKLSNVSYSVDDKGNVSFVVSPRAAANKQVLQYSVDRDLVEDTIKMLLLSRLTLEPNAMLKLVDRDPETHRPTGKPISADMLEKIIKGVEAAGVNPSSFIDIGKIKGSGLVDRIGWGNARRARLDSYLSSEKHPYLNTKETPITGVHSGVVPRSEERSEVPRQHEEVKSHTIKI